MMLVSTLSYIDRHTLALLAPTILRETHLSNAQYGFIISAFSITYMFGNPPWGRIVDRFGVRMSMTTAVSLWTLASVSHVFAAGFRGFLLARTPHADYHDPSGSCLGLARGILVHRCRRCALAGTLEPGVAAARSGTAHRLRGIKQSTPME
jgi:MFS family permease